MHEEPEGHVPEVLRRGVRCAALVCLPLLLIAPQASAQAPGVTVYDCCEGEQKEEGKRAVAQAEGFRKAGKLLDLPTVKAQLSRSQPIRIELPAPLTQAIPASVVWDRARASYLRIGYYYLCKKCSDWHLNLAGGYVIAKDGIAATCHHVIASTCTQMKEGYLVAVDDQGKVYPVTEILVSRPELDTAIVKTGATQLPALPLNTDVKPGDHAYLFSDPQGRRGYFSEGMVNRFVNTVEAGSKVIRMNVGTDWAPGSSGAAILDAFGNCIGHVSTLSTLGDDEDGKRSETHLVLHNAVRAADVLELVGKAATPESSPFPILNGEEAWKAQQEGVLFLDARPQSEYLLGHIPGAVSVPLRQPDFEDRLWDFVAGPRAKPQGPVVLYCSGCCSTDALFLALRLKELGFKQIQIYRDGFPGWARAERPIAKGTMP
jgi:rhodanese-related sulfurtransferase